MAKCGSLKAEIDWFRELSSDHFQTISRPWALHRDQQMRSQYGAAAGKSLTLIKNFARVFQRTSKSVEVFGGQSFV